VLNSAALHFNNDAATFSKDIEIGSGQNGYIRSYGYNKIASGAGATIAGNVFGEGTLTSSDDGDVTFSGTVDIGAYVARKSGGISVFSGDSTKIGTLTMNDGTTVNFTAGTNEITTANVSGGTLDISDSTSTTITTANFSGGTISGGNITTANVTSGTVAVSGSTIGTLKQTGGTVNFSGKTALTNLGISQGTVNVSSVLNVSGSANGTRISEASFFLNDSGTGTLNVKSGGVVNVTSAHISVRDGTGTLNVETGGEINFGTGLNVTKNGNWGAATFNLNGGRINVGSSGIQRPSLSVVTYNFNSGTIGSLADSWSSTENLVFGGAITIDTARARRRRLRFRAGSRSRETIPRSRFPGTAPLRSVARFTAQQWALTPPRKSRWAVVARSRSTRRVSFMR